MVHILLDIGAGGTHFVSSFRKANKHLELTCLCGEPEYLQQWSRIVRSGLTENIRASYGALGLPSNSLDFITMNAHHPFSPLRGLEEEVVRCLKPGGVFISAHPVGSHPKIENEHLTEVISGSRFCKKSGVFPRYEALLKIPQWNDVHYPASLTIRDRLLVLRYPEVWRGRLAGCVYRSRCEEPTVRAWQKV